MEPHELAGVLARDRPEWEVTVDGTVVTITDPRFDTTVVWDLDARAQTRLERRRGVDRRMARESMGPGASGRAMLLVSVEEVLDTFTGTRGHVEVGEHGALRIVDDSP